MDEPAPAEPSPGDRLDSWKEIAAYLRRDVSTVQRWEKREGMPVRRHLHDKLGSVYALRSELDAWIASRLPRLGPEVERDDLPASGRARAPSGPGRRRRPRFAAWALVAGAVTVVGVVWWLLPRPEGRWARAIAEARRATLTDFDGAELAAAISRDGRFVAFVSDRDGRMDVWVTQRGSGQFHNLTRGRVRELVNPSVRTLGFSPDGESVTFWARGVEGAGSDAISIWAIPILGGQPRLYVEGAAEFDWSPDGARLAYHTPGPGDPLFIRAAASPASDEEIHSAAAGQHAHFPTWSPDGRFIYFVQGSLPDAMDIYRIDSRDRHVERITHLDAGVSHPVFLDRGTLAFLVRARDETTSRLHVIAVDRREPRPVETGFDRYTSLAASADGRRLVATLANPKGTLWRLALADEPVGAAAASTIPLPTGRGVAPRLGPGFLLYVSKKGATDAVWKLADGTATEIWSVPDARIIGGPALDAQGRRLAVAVEQSGRTLLHVMNADGTHARVVADDLQLHGSPAWTPDGYAITTGAVVDGRPHLLRIPLDGSPTSLVETFAVDPAWAPAGDFVVYSTADIGTRFAVQAATADGREHALPSLTLTRGARRLRFVPGQRTLVVMRGDLGHKNLWLIDLDTGTERQVTDFPPGFSVRDFDLSVDGREIVVERVQDHSDIVLIDLSRRD